MCHIKSQCTLTRLSQNTSLQLCTTSLRLTMATTFSTRSRRRVSHQPCLLLLFISLVNHPDHHNAHPYAWAHYTWQPGCRVWHCSCQPLFSAVTTGDCSSSLVHCWASFAWCKSAHVGQGDKYGCALGLLDQNLSRRFGVPLRLNCGFIFTHLTTFFCIKCLFKNEM